MSATQLLTFQKELFPTVEMLSGLHRPGAITSVTFSPLFAGSMRASEAIWLRDLMLRRGDPKRKVATSPDLREHARAVSDWLDGCERRPVPLTSLIRVAQAMLPDLTTGDLDEVWYSVASRGCARLFSAQDRDWVAFLQAVGRRDGAGMAATSRRLLAAEPELGAPSKRYLVAAGLLGSIVQKDFAAARELWSHYEQSLGPAKDLLLSVLVAQSIGEPGAPRR